MFTFCVFLNQLASLHVVANSLDCVALCICHNSVRSESGKISHGCVDLTSLGVGSHLSGLASRRVGSCGGGCVILRVGVGLSLLTSLVVSVGGRGLASGRVHFGISSLRFTIGVSVSSLSVALAVVLSVRLASIGISGVTHGCAISLGRGGRLGTICLCGLSSLGAVFVLSLLGSSSVWLLSLSSCDSILCNLCGFSAIGLLLNSSLAAIGVFVCSLLSTIRLSLCNSGLAVSIFRVNLFSAIRLKDLLLCGAVRLSHDGDLFTCSVSGCLLLGLCAIFIGDHSSFLASSRIDSGLRVDLFAIFCLLLGGYFAISSLCAGDLRTVSSLLYSNFFTSLRVLGNLDSVSRAVRVGHNSSLLASGRVDSFLGDAHLTIRRGLNRSSLASLRVSGGLHVDTIRAGD